MYNEDQETISEERADAEPTVVEQQPSTADGVITLLSGAVVEMRPLRIADENYMATARKSRKGRALEQALEQILTRCTVQVLDPGMYSFLSEGGRVDWHKMLTGDRVEAMFQLRKLSYKEGHLYVVENVNCPACRNVWDHEFNVNEDMIHQPLSEESRKRYQAGETFPVTINEQEVRFKLQDGATEEMFDKLRKRFSDRQMAAGLRSRIVSVSGVDTKDIMDWLDGNNGASKKYEGLSSDAAEELRDAFDAVDCGVDTEVEAECPECYRLIRFTLPFDSMFVPGRNIRARKRARRGMDSSAP